MKNAITYTAHTIEIDGVAESVRYTIRRNSNVIVHLLGAGVTMELSSSDADYAAALEAANLRKAEDVQQAAARLAAAKADGSKWWIGQTLKGKGWKIVADGGYDRIRVTFARRPSEAQKEAVKAAGFCWSPALKSWNRGLKCKAWRAAEQLAITLKNLDDPNAAARAQARKLDRELEREAV